MLRVGMTYLISICVGAEILPAFCRQNDCGLWLQKNDLEIQLLEN